MGFAMETSLNKKSPVRGKSKLKPGVKTTTKPKIQRAEQRATSIKTLKDSELRYRRLFEAAQDGILILDARTGAIDDVNPYLIAMLGYSREEFVKRKLWEVGAFKDVEASKIEFKVLQEKGFVRHENLPLRAKGGQLIQVEFVSNVYLAGARKVIQCNIRNITDRFRLEEALQESDKRFRALIENSSDAITLLDAGGRVVFDSPAAAGMLGYAPEDWFGKEIFPLIHPEDLPEIQGLFQKLAGTPGARAAGTFRLRHKSGAWLWIEATAANLLAEPAVKAMVINYRDVTGRKQAEEALRESEEVFRGFLEQSEDAIMLTDEKGVVTQWSKGAEKLTGYARDELVGKPLWDVQLRSAPEAFKSTELYAQMKASLQSALLTGQGIVLNHLMEIEIQRPDGTRLMTQTLAFPIHTQKGLMLGSILRDISELKRAQEAAQHSADLLSEALHIARLAHWEYDVENDLFLFNDHLYSIFHTTAEREGGYTMSSAQYAQRFVHPDDAPVVGVEIEKALASTDRNYRTQLEHRILYSDGGIGTISVVIHIDRDEQGRILRYYGVNQDITQRKRAEAEIKKLAKFPDENPYPILRLNENGIISYANAASRALLEDWKTAIGQEAPPSWRKKVVEALANGSSQLVESSLGAQVLSFEVVPVRDEGYVNLYSRDITDRKLAEEELQASEVRFRRLFDDSPVALWEEDYWAVRSRLEALREEGITNFQEYFSSHPETVAECAALVKIVNVNKATMSLFGSNRKEEMLKSLAQLLKDEQIKEYKRELINIAEGKTRFGWEGINKTLDGRLINIEMSWSVVAYGPENTLSRVIVSMIDITERKKAAAALAESEREYRTLFENMPIGLYRTSADGRFLDANQAMVEMFGYKDRKTLLAENVVDLYVDPASDRKFKTEIEKSGVVSNFETESKRADGTTFWTEDHTHLIRNEKGKPLFYEGSLIDITERKQARDALRDAKDYAENIVQTANIIFLQLDASGNVQNFNSAAEQITGYDRAEVLGRNWAEIMVPKERNASAWQEFDRLVNKGGDPTSFEKPIITKLGEETKHIMEPQCSA